ncbi:MAG: 30S ribosomal protein S8 [Anaerolineae bacterium]|jgi:small subunit ribosomal protein S8|nr:30S ribosomal protein S8 [Chloroflexota bacterium]
MSFSDPIADMLTRIRNGQAVGRRYVLVPFSGVKQALASVLQEEGYIDRFEIVRDGRFPMLRVFLKYTRNQEPLILGLRRVSKPGRRIYAKRSEIPWVRYGLGTVILSTPKGVLSGREARRQQVGGEVLCEVW